MKIGYTNAMYDFAEPELQEPAEDNWETFSDESDEFTKETHTCGLCGCVYVWSADDISWECEASPFMPCGHKWEFLDRVVE